jgi:hypothetical protein
MCNLFIQLLYPLCRRLGESPTACLDVMEKRAVCCPYQESNQDFPGSLVHSLVAEPIVQYVRTVKIYVKHRSIRIII